jgi:23S rRNA (adenine-N6)-dimethyltransferase
VAPPSRAWGRHLLDPRWAERLVALAGVRAGDLVVDVGAGLGAITAPLVDVGARVVAVEMHPQRAQVLRERFGGRVIVVQADAADLRLPRRPYSVVANPPFGVTTALLRRVLQPGSRLLDAHLVLQEQAARRWASAAAPGGHRWGRTFAASTTLRVPRRAFRPPPPVDTRVLTVRRRSSPQR